MKSEKFKARIKEGEWSRHSLMVKMKTSILFGLEYKQQQKNHTL